MLDFHVLCKVSFLFDFGNNYETWKLQNEKTWVGFGHTEVSVWLDYIVFCTLTFGHGLRNPGFRGLRTSLDCHAICRARERSKK